MATTATKIRRWIEVGEQIRTLLARTSHVLTPRGVLFSHDTFRPITAGLIARSARVPRGSTMRDV